MVTQGRKEESLVFSDSPEGFYQRMNQLNQLRKNRKFCDVVLQVGSAEIHAHRSVLSCASPYFFELFTADDEGRTASEDKLIYKLNGGFDRESVELIVSYAYTGNFEASSPMVKASFITANILKMYSIAMKCGEYLVSNLSPETCLSIRALPGISASSQLVSRVDAYIQDQPDLLTVTRDPSGVPRVMLKVILRSWDDWSITSRALVSLCLDWIRKQIMEEDTNLEVLQDKMHLLYLNLDNSLHDCSDIQAGTENDSDIVQDYKKIARKHSQTNMKVRRKNSQNSNPTKPRMMLFSRSINDSDEDYNVDGEWKIIAYSKTSDNHTESSYIGIVSLNGLVTILSIQPHLQKTFTATNSRPPSVEKVNFYTLIPHMSTPRCGSGVGTLKDSLLVCGGYDRGECLNDVQLYNPQTNQWKDLPNMYQSRGRFDLTVLDGKAYAIGGSNGTKELNMVEVLDEDQVWSNVAPLPLARSNAGITSLEGKIYCIGGWNGKYGIKQCDMYDPELDEWTTVAPLHTGRYQAGVASCNGFIYAVGGCDLWNCLGSVEVYNPLVDTWRHVANMNTPRRGCGLTAFEGKLYVLGGSDGTQSLCSVEIYDPQTNSWSVGPSMTSCRANVGTTVVGDRIYAVGGFSGKTFLNNIEFLDQATQEWTNFTPKPEVLLRRSDSEERDITSVTASTTSLSLSENVIHENENEVDESSDYGQRVKSLVQKSAPISINGHGSSEEELEIQYALESY